MAWKLVILGIIFLIILLWGYAIIAGIRKGWMQFQNKRKHGSLPTVVIGNITVGGTGKTPFILFMSQLFSEQRIAILSRGYGRNSRGYLEVETNSNSKVVGDEPLELKSTLTAEGIQVKVVVGENRLKAINRIAEDVNGIELVFLDDGLQHVSLLPDVSVVLTPFEKPFNREHFSLPIGSLREFSNAAKQYDYLVVTKCPSKLSQARIERWWEENSSGLSFSRENVFFAEYTIESEFLNEVQFKSDFRKEIEVENRIIGESSFNEIDIQTVAESEKSLNIDHSNQESVNVNSKSCLLITGIVNTNGIQNYLSNIGFSVSNHFNYSDHHYFGLKELKEWLKYSLECGVRCWFTTRKDWQRLKDVIEECKEIFPIDFSLKVGIVYTKVHILEGRKEEFKNKIVNKLKENKR
jgi:tetraacyldisaccharide-1-P 4'-kinase